MNLAKFSLKGKNAIITGAAGLLGLEHTFALLENGASVWMLDIDKTKMEKSGVPILPGYHSTNQTPSLLKDSAKQIGFPVLIKAVSGGGGKGMPDMKGMDGLEDLLGGGKGKGPKMPF